MPFFSPKQVRHNYDAGLLNFKFSAGTEILQVFYNFPVRSDIRATAFSKTANNLHCY